jgi:mannose-6-phosphate isomerase-like protein (cupin superfamily)
MKLLFKKSVFQKTISIEEAITENKSPFKMSKWSLKEGLISPVDVHQVKEYWLISEGKGEINYNNELIIKVKKGDFIFMESNKTHQVENTGSEDLVVFSIWW